MSDISRLIKKGEGKTTEFKETLPGKGGLVKTAVAFSNTAGGKILVGIEDKTGRITGISNEDVMDFPDRICDMIYDSCYPMILPEIYVENEGNKKILVAEFYPGALKPYYLKSKGRDRGAYIRVGATNKAADSEMLQELERQRQNISFDEQIILQKTDKDIDFQKLKQDFFRLTHRKLGFNDLLNLRIIKAENKKYHPTAGGIMLAGREDSFEYARIRCARFRGSSMSEFTDQKEFTGSLYEQVEGAMKFAQLWIARSGRIEGLQRKDQDEVPLEAVREALVNAVVHRDYSISGSDIKLAILDDRIEFTSPGALPRSLEIEDILAGRSEIRNKIIARFFKEIGFIEQWGTGMRKMLTLCNDAGLSPPEFRESGLFFKVTFFKKTETHQDCDDSREKESLPGDYPETTRKIAAVIRDEPHTTRKEIARQLGISEEGVKYHLKKLRKDGMLQRVGPGRGGYWEIDAGIF
ncbi:MAG: hypothetical protein B6245_12225 [Desulfobacteraceae bacterium 4572_88]|nr:MAG: hypothetical protein B6245_12225 [Desulfobacteraceae bacterium 4572_88]